MDPIHQFTVVPLVPIEIGGVDLSFTNAALFMALASGLVVWLILSGTRDRLLVPDRRQSMVEVLYEFINALVYSNAGPAARPFVPFIFSLFTFILVGNLLGMIPYCFTFTSHLIVTAALALVVFIMVTALGLYRHGWHFFKRFAPQGVPPALLPLMVPLEVVSYLIRPVSLSVRLFANMMAGHTMLKVFAGFIILLSGGLGVAGYVLGLLPLVMLVVLTGFELFVSAIQAYVFALLTVIYIQDAYAKH